MGFEGSERNGFEVLLVKKAGREVRQPSAIDRGLKRGVVAEDMVERERANSEKKKIRGRKERSLERLRKG